MTATTLGLCVARSRFTDRPALPINSAMRPTPGATLGDMAGEFVRHVYGGIAPRGGFPDRNHLLEITAQYIQQHADVSDVTAQTTAAQAISEYECRRWPLSFDVDKSTSHAVFLRDQRTGHLHVITALEMSRLLSLGQGQPT